MAPGAAQLAFRSRGGVMRVGLVCPYDLSKPGGVQQVVIELGRHLQAGGDEVLVVAPGEPVGESGLAIRSVGDSIGVPANASIAPIALSPKVWNETLRAIADVDLVHLHEPFIPLVGWAALRQRDHPAVATFHANPPGWARALYKGLSSLGERALDPVITTATGPVSAGAVPPAWGKPHIVPVALDVDSYDVAVERRPNRVAFLGRDEPRKGLSVLLQAWPRIRERRPDAELEVMGSDRNAQIPGVTFHGRADETLKRQVLGSSLVYVAPNTKGEGFGVVVAEGMAAGCAVVASSLEAFRSVLGDAGILVPVGDSSAVAGEVVRLLDDIVEARRLGDHARDRVRRFDWPAVVGGYRKAYAEALS